MNVIVIWTFRYYRVSHSSYFIEIVQRDSFAKRYFSKKQKKNNNIKENFFNHYRYIRCLFISKYASIFLTISSIFNYFFHFISWIVHQSENFHARILLNLVNRFPWNNFLDRRVTRICDTNLSGNCVSSCLKNRFRENTHLQAAVSLVSLF